MTYEVVRSIVDEVTRFSVYDVARLHTNSVDRQYHQRLRATEFNWFTILIGAFLFQLGIIIALVTMSGGAAAFTEWSA